MQDQNKNCLNISSEYKTCTYYQFSLTGYLFINYLFPLSSLILIDYQLYFGI